MLEEFLKEFNELKEYKKKYEYAIKDKETMSELLYEYMMKEYESISVEERVLVYRMDFCSNCRHRYYCTIDLPEDICKPIPSDKGWIPARVGCRKFEWS